MLEYLILLPSAVTTSFFVESGPLVTRLLLISAILGYFIENQLIQLVFSTIAILTALQDLKPQEFKLLNIFAYFGVYQAVLFCAAQHCVSISPKKLTDSVLNSYFGNIVVQSLALTTSLSYLSLYVVKMHNPVIVVGLQTNTIIVFQALIKSRSSDYQQGQYGNGFGVSTNQGLQQSDSYYQSLFSRWNGFVVIISIVQSLVLGLITMVCMDQYNLTVGTIIVLGSVVASLIQVFAMILLMKGGIKLLQKISNNILKSDEEELLEGDLPTEASKIRPPMTPKQLIKQILIPSWKEILWAILFCGINYSIQILYEGTRNNIYQWISIGIYSLISAKTILHQSQGYFIMQFLTQLILINRYIPAFTAFGIMTLINYIQSQPYSTTLMYSAGMMCLAFSGYSKKWIFNIVACTMYIPTTITKLERNNIGVKIQIFLQTFVLDLLIGLPRSAVKNLVVCLVVVTAIIQYGNLFMQSAVGKSVCFQNVISIITRVIINIFNSFILNNRSNLTHSQIISVVAMWNGIFASVVSLGMQIFSYCNLGEKIGRGKYGLTIPVFIMTNVIVTFTPLFIIVLGTCLLISGMLSILELNQQNPLQDAVILLYELFYVDTESNTIPYLITLFFCRILSGFIIASVVVFVVNYSTSALEQKYNQLLIQLIFSSFVSIFAILPTMLDERKEGKEITFGKITTTILLFVCILSMQYIRIEGSMIKLLYAFLYAGVAISAFISQEVVTSFVLLLYMLLLAFIPQSVIVVAYILGTILLMMYSNTRYLASTISYDALIITFIGMTILYLLRFQAIKRSVILKLAKKMKVENVGCKINSQAFNVDEADLDIFMSLNEQENVDNTTPLKTYNSLYKQQQFFLITMQIALFNWGFYPIIILLTSFTILLCPVDQRDKDGNLRQIAGYIGIMEGWRLNLHNRIALIQRYCTAAFLGLILWIAMDFVVFAILLLTDYQAYLKGLKSLIIDEIMLVIQLPGMLIGYTYMTGVPQRCFNKLVNFQRKKLCLALSIIMMLSAAFSTNQVLKLTPAFVICAYQYQAAEISETFA